MARIREAEGDFGRALELLDEAERRYVGDFFPNVRPVPAVRARVWVRLGEFRCGHRVGRTTRASLPTTNSAICTNSSTSRSPGFFWPSTTATEPRLTIRQATDLLTRLLAAAEEGDRAGSVIEILVLLALAHQLQGDTRAGLIPLERALALAEPEGYVRIFVDEGAPMAALLAAVPDGAGSYVRQLLTAFGKADIKRPTKQLCSIRSVSENSRCFGCSPASCPVRRSPVSWSCR